MEQPSALGPVITRIPEPRRGGVTDYSSPGSQGRVRPGPGFLPSGPPGGQLQQAPVKPDSKTLTHLILIKP